MPEHQTAHREFELLCSAVRPAPDLERVHGILAQGIDPACLGQLAEWHGVRPGLLQCFSALSWKAVPAALRESLTAFQHEHLLHRLASFDELRQICERFAAQGVTFAAFKGPALAVDLHDGLAWREYVDLDVIVAEGELAAAERILEGMGYACAGGGRAFRRAFLAAQRQCEFSRTNAIATVDLHWDFCGSHVPFPLAARDIWGDLRFVAIENCRIPTLSPANQALMLAGHGTKEAWSSLKWVCDFARLIERHRGIDWTDLHRRARARGCGDAVLLGCAMAQRLLGTPIPEPLVPLVERSRRVHTLADLFVARMRDGSLPPSIEQRFTDLGLCETGVGKLNSMVALAITPTAGDYQAMPLPRPLWPAYYVVRPLRLLAKATGLLH